MVTSVLSYYKGGDSMAITPSITNISVVSYNTFNGKSISNITYHSLKFTVSGDAHTAYFCNIAYDDVKYVYAVNGNTTVEVPIGVFVVESGDSIIKTISVSINGINVTTITENVSIQIYNYVMPKITANIVRNDDEKPVITYEYTHQETVAGEANTLTMLRVACVTDEHDYEYQFADKTSPQVLDGEYRLDKSYRFDIAISDSVMTSVSKEPLSVPVILPSDAPVMDIGADGKTVTFFGVSPRLAEKNTLRIGDIASFSDKIVLGNNEEVYSEIDSKSFKIYTKGSSIGDGSIASIGMGEAVTPSGNKVLGPFYTLGTRRYDEIDGVGLVMSDAGTFSVVEGDQCEASGSASHAEGAYNCATGMYSHAGGRDSAANGIGSFVHGHGIQAEGLYQAVFGEYNVVDTNGNYMFIVGNGTSDYDRKNALAVAEDGDVEVNGKSLNGMTSGIVGHWYATEEVDTGSNNTYITLPCLTNQSLGALGNLVMVNQSNHTLTFNKTGVYAFNVRITYRSSTADKRAELSPFINGTRASKYSVTFCTPGFTLFDTKTYIMKLNAGDNVVFKVTSGDNVKVTCGIKDLDVIALDYEGKYR